MLTGELRSQIDAIWNAFWTGGISNPLEVIVLLRHHSVLQLHIGEDHQRDLASGRMCASNMAVAIASTTIS